MCVQHKINSCFLSGFYIATQLWFSACVLLTVFGLFYTTLYMYLNRSVERYVHILLTAGGLYIVAGRTHLFICYVTTNRLIRIYIFVQPYVVQSL